MDKLAEEIYSKMDDIIPWYVPSEAKAYIIEAMQEYAELWHSAKMQEVTDEDIETWADRDRKKLIDDEVWTTAELKERIWGRTEGAKAMRDGEIKHKEG